MIRRLANHFKFRKMQKRLAKRLKETDERPVWQTEYISCSDEVIKYKSDTVISKKDYGLLTNITEEELYNGSSYMDLAMFLSTRVFNATKTVSIRIEEQCITILILSMFYSVEC